MKCVINCIQCFFYAHCDFISCLIRVGNVENRGSVTHAHIEITDKVGGAMLSRMGNKTLSHLLRYDNTNNNHDNTNNNKSNNNTQ